MLAEGFHLFFQIVTVYTTKPKLRWYYILGWGIPTVIVSVSVGLRLEYYGINKICWLSINSGLIWAFVGPAIAIIAVNFIILLIVIRIAASKAAFQVSARSIGRWKSFKSSAKAIAVLLPILGLTWLFGILSIDANTIFFSYLFVIFNGLQGVSFFIMHCLLNTEIRSTLLRRANKFRYESSSGPSMLKAVRKKTNVTSFAMADHEIQHARASSISMDNDDDIGLQRLYTGTSILRHPSGTPSCNTVISAFSFPEENETILNQPTD
ncbi:uncharacterized protein TRIADDRAFT_58102 [Trichoplax adhaerens]|uniref:G-protein coupled receptors family 2 profile 2 domain-containing protein n=1 Tax=Trichoplax adhaerens TaxID=10228 RepID=B3S2P7_TRIAD|nr:hypothetical protein TRIADDRAFT_58102 [Trichoplax adhaerens]EDV23457.1 hypothetical protein TRIADDRAFT_58102 [Trichoplax adhaerens]|eukprot:XP_002114367.1 hypothetical protein TRIADDRAFT_58102 [Trichoplax adhaerens]